MNVLQVEVATYTRHSAESLGDFLFRVKLDPTKKVYSADTVIVVFVQRGCTPAEIRTAHEELLQREARGLCYNCHIRAARSGLPPAGTPP